MSMAVLTAKIPKLKYFDNEIPREDNRFQSSFDTARQR
jgi:hypothetical protein